MQPGWEGMVFDSSQLKFAGNVKEDSAFCSARFAHRQDIFDRCELFGTNAKYVVTESRFRSHTMIGEVHYKHVDGFVEVDLDNCVGVNWDDVRNCSMILRLIGVNGSHRGEGALQ